LSKVVYSDPRWTTVVAGSGSKIGEAISHAHAQAGATVVTNSRARERADATASTIRQDGGTAPAVEADVSDRAGTQALVDADPSIRWVSSRCRRVPLER